MWNASGAFSICSWSNALTANLYPGLASHIEIESTTLLTTGLLCTLTLRPGGEGGWPVVPPPHRWRLLFNKPRCIVETASYAGRCNYELDRSFFKTFLKIFFCISAKMHRNTKIGGKALKSTGNWTSNLLGSGQPFSPPTPWNLDQNSCKWITKGFWWFFPNYTRHTFQTHSTRGAWKDEYFLLIFFLHTHTVFFVLFLYNTWGKCIRRDKCIF